MVRWARSLSTAVLMVLTALALAVAVGVACTPQQTEAVASRTPLRVCATIFPLYDFATRIAGERAQVSLLLPPGADVHLWEPGVDTLRSLGRVDLLIYNGAGLEPWLEKIVAAAGNPRLRLVDASEGLALHPMGGGEVHGHAAGEKARSRGAQEPGAYDPHVWLDPVRAKRQAANIRDALVAADPEGKNFYSARYDALARRLDHLDFLFRTVLAGTRHKDFVVSHAAFGYLASRYGLQQIALTGPEGEAEPSPAHLAVVAGLYRGGGRRYLFIDALHGGRAAATVAREVGAEVLALHHLAALTPTQATAGEDYFSLMEENLVNLYRGLE